ncbi:MAG: AAA family ATPase [Gemmatimonadales bacterium]
MSASENPAGPDAASPGNARPRRVAIIGCGGSGKSTLAVRLGRRLSLPVHHLDRLYWKPGWAPTPAAEWEALQRRLVAEPEWIMDGNYGGTMDVRLDRADTIVFLDLPTRTCLAGALGRYRRYRGRTRPELVPGCDERLTGEYLWWIWTYRRRRRPGIVARLRRLEGSRRVVVLKSRAEVNRFADAAAGPAS